MPVVNGSFEDQGSIPGEAFGWVMASSTSLEAVAPFGTPPLGFDAFNWSSTLDDLMDDGLWAFARFGLIPKNYDSFEGGWQNDNYQITLTDGFAEQASFSLAGYEWFEDGWANDSAYVTDFDLLATAAMPSNPEEWDVATFETDFDSVPLAAKIFTDPTTAQEESFGDPSWPPLALL